MKTQTNPIVVRDGRYYRQSDPSYMLGCDTEWELRYYELEMDAQEYITDTGEEPPIWWHWKGQVLKALHRAETHPTTMIAICSVLGLALGVALYLAF